MPSSRGSSRPRDGTEVCNAGDLDSIPGSGRSPGEGKEWTDEPGRLQSIGSQRVGHDWSNLACMYTHTETNTIF